MVRRSIRRGRVSLPKSGRTRRVDLSPQLVAALEGLRTLQDAEAVLAGHAPHDRTFSTRGASVPMTGDGFRDNAWRSMLHRAGVAYRKPHALRHTYASLLIEAGEPLTYISTQLGHHSPAFTLATYGHLLPCGDRRAVDGLDDGPGATVRNLTATTPARGQSLPVFPRG